MKVFSERLRQSRKAKNYTQVQMAELLQMRQQSYTRYENNKGEPNLEILVQICRILEENPAYLLGMEDF
ncbi:MAG: helix-turn-helix domain-containing protein [Clostridiales bacterium]|nr:helix-turn-helix domain-containing protein [Clostridiales bacterium]